MSGKQRQSERETEQSSGKTVSCNDLQKSSPPMDIGQPIKSLHSITKLH